MSPTGADTTPGVAARSAYLRGAHDGLPLGVALAACALCAFLGVTRPPLSVAALALAVAVPVMAVRMLRRSWHQDLGLSTFSELWLQGIVAFVCGCLLMGAAVLVFLMWVQPDYLVTQAQRFAATALASPDADLQHWGRYMQAVLDHHMLPRPIYVVFEMMLMGIFTGSMWCMAVAAVMVRLRHPSERQQP